MGLHMHHPGALDVLLLLGALTHITPYVTARDRDYYVAAVTSDWDYSNGQADSSEYVFKKIIFKEYEKGFQKAKPTSKLSGILGPTLRAEVGDTLKVHFKNMASKPLTIHPQGISYGKAFEGAKYADGTSSLEKEGDSVRPGEMYTYKWDITMDVGPKEADPDCLTSSYYSMENPVQDVNSGLIGALLICKNGSLQDDGTQKNFNKDYVLMFGVFDESKSWQKSLSPKETPLMYTVNGFVKGAVPAFTACVGDKISWHILGLSSKPEFFSIHFFEHSLEQNHHKVSIISLASMATTTANMTVSESGKWKISSLVEKHLEVSMHGYLEVNSCERKAQNKHRLSVHQTRHIQMWDYYVAAVEVDWDYASGTSENSEKTYCHHPFKKVVYKKYTDSTFTETIDNSRELGLIGPVIRAQVKDTIMVVFKNMASQPHNIYPHGVSLQRFFTGYAPDLKGTETQNSTVMPGETATYYWTILNTDEPTKSDPQCLTRIYHSTVNIVKDLASGLLGTLLICKSMTLNTRGLQDKTDKEQIAMFTVFDENKSWYYEQNKPKACNKVLNKDSKSLYNSYVINSINGNSYENSILGFCDGHVIQWHVSSVGVQDETITLQLTGHTFRYKLGYGDMLTLFPMTGESISIEMDNKGVWLFGNYNSKVTTLRFRNAKCIDEEDYYDDVPYSTIVLNTPEEKGTSEESSEESPTIIQDASDDNDYSDRLADLFMIRSLRNNTGAIEEAENLTAIALGSHDDNGQDSVNQTDLNVYDFFGSSEEDVSRIDGSEYVSKNDTFLKSNASEGIKGKHVLQDVHFDQHNKLNEKEEFDSSIPSNSTDLESESNSILPNDDNEGNSTLYLQESSVEEEDRKSMQTHGNGSDIETSRNVTKRRAEIDAGNSSSEYVLKDNGLQNSTSDTRGLRSSDIQKSVSSLKKPENSTDLPILGKVTSETPYFMEQIDDNIQVTITYNTKSDDPGNGGNHMSTTASPAPNNLQNVTITHESAHTQTPMTSSVSPPFSIDDFHDPELEEIFGSKKKVRNMKEKRTAVNNNIHGLRENETLYDEHTAPNNSLHGEVGNGTFTPRGFSPRGHNPTSLKPRGYNPALKPEIVIGISKGMQGDYEEYDHDAAFFMDEDKAKPQYLLFEEPYKIETEDDVNRYTNPDRIAANFMRTSKGTKRMYYIAAEEVQWDYTGGSRRNQVNQKPIGETRQTMYKKVVFRQYLDNTFTKPDVEGEYEEHLGILGPVIRAEVEDVIQVTFKNLASQPYSIHAHGVSYEKSSEGYRYDDETQDWLKQDEVIQPHGSNVYVWYATQQSGPEQDGSACKTWAYHSGVNTEKDIHSGLIGPLIICKPGTLDKQTNRPLDAREFILLFMSFEEEKSWYFNKNSKKTCADITEKSSNGMNCHTFHAINGITYNLQGINMYQNELVRLHLLNMGGPKDIHVVNFHGQTMTEQIKAEFQHPTYPLMPGTFATVEMKPARVGIWMLDTEVAEYQQAGMQTLFNVVEKGCNFPLGLESRIISDEQITASHYIDPWEPKLARINNVGSYNAWSAHMNRSSLPWIQVDLQKIFLISGIQTQGAKKYFTQYYIQEFFIAYSKDKKKWNVFKGNSTAIHKLFEGNSDSSTIKKNHFNPPIAARYIRVFPTKFNSQPSLRMELLGCEIQGCSAPLGMENYNIKDAQITASSHKSSYFTSPWLPSLARLNKAGNVNAWQAQSSNNQQWLQIDFVVSKRITGIMTQGARSFRSEMYVTSYIVQSSDNGKKWQSYMDTSTSMEKIFKGNSDSYGYIKNEFNPPIFSRYLRIIPKSWNKSIVMRLEVYGCDA
ncbi:coagulation factor V isoform X2 [Eleutherodactylus coqui]|uniref:coagulation factor V isoform X2 n=1 Tax=Eleutherodactylus coqui TaxID=57060 RepID=UPI003462E58A